MPFTIRPYRFEPERLGLSLGFDGEKPDHVSERLWSYEGRKIPERITFSVSLEVPETSKHLFQPSEQTRPPGKAVATVTCLLARKKFRVDLKPENDRWVGQFSCPLKKLDGSLEIEGFLIRKVAAKNEVDEFASAANSILSTSPVTKVILRPEKNPKGGDILTRWKNFDELPPPANEYSEAVYHLDLLANPPILYLNEKLPDDLRSLINVEATRGSKAMVRDAFLMPIVADVWEQLVTEALNSLAERQDLESLKPWQRNVIATVACGLTGKADQEDAINSLAESCEDQEELSVLIEKRLPMFVQVKTDLAERFNKVAARELT